MIVGTDNNKNKRTIAFGPILLNVRRPLLQHHLSNKIHTLCLFDAGARSFANAVKMLCPAQLNPRALVIRTTDQFGVISFPSNSSVFILWRGISGSKYMQMSLNAGTGERAVG